MAEPRHIRVVTDPAVLAAGQDRRWLASQGYGPKYPFLAEPPGTGRAVMRSMANFGDTTSTLD